LFQGHNQCIFVPQECIQTIVLLSSIHIDGKVADNKVIDIVGHIMEVVAHMMQVVGILGLYDQGVLSYMT
jgi:hypothetical protein